MERFFNTAGPNRPNFNYTLDPLKRFDLELKILRGDLEKTIEEGLQQTWEYMDISGGVEEGHLIIFDRSKTRPWEEKIWRREMDYQGHPITVWGM